MRGLVVAMNYHQYMNFIRRFNLERNTWRYVDSWEKASAYDFKTPVVILNGYQWNNQLSLGFMHYLGMRYQTYFLSEKEIYGDENISVNFKSN